MAEMSTLNGYEIVDKKARDMIAGGNIGNVTVYTDNYAQRLYSHFKNDNLVYPFLLVIYYPDKNTMDITFSKSIYWNSSKAAYIMLALDAVTDIPVAGINDPSDMRGVIDWIITNVPTIPPTPFNGSKDLTKSTITGSHCYTNFKIEGYDDVVTLYDLNTSLDGILRFSRKTCGVSSTDRPLLDYGTAGQFVVTNGDGSIGFTSLDIAEGGEY